MYGHPLHFDVEDQKFANSPTHEAFHLSNARAIEIPTLLLLARAALLFVASSRLRGDQVTPSCRLQKRGTHNDARITFLVGIYVKRIRR